MKNNNSGVILWGIKKILLAICIEKNKDTKIIVEGEDPRRFRVYEKALSKYGYKKNKKTRRMGDGQIYF